MIVPIYVAWVEVISAHDELSYEFEEVSYRPIPTHSRPGPNESTWNYAFGDAPRYWIKTPPLAAIRDEKGGAALCLSGEKHSARAAWVLLSAARRGDPRFPFVEAPQTKNLSKPAEIIHQPIQAPPPPPAALVAPSRRQFPVYRVRDLWMFEEPAGFYSAKLGWDVEVYTIDAPRESRVENGNYWYSDRDPIGECPEMVVRNAEARRFDLELAHGSARPPLSPGAKKALGILINLAITGQLPPPTPKRRAVAKPDGQVVEDKIGQALFAWADSPLQEATVSSP